MKTFYTIIIFILSFYQFNMLIGASLPSHIVIENNINPVQPSLGLKSYQKPNSLFKKNKTPKKNKHRSSKGEFINTLLVFSLFPLLGLGFGLVFAEATLIITAGIFTSLILFLLLISFPLGAISSKLKGVMKLLLLVSISTLSIMHVMTSSILFIVGLCTGNVTLWAVSLGILFIAMFILLLLNMKY